MKAKIPVIVILGPTATGKTSLSIELARYLEQKTGQNDSVRINNQKKAEIISADSRQVYKGLDIGTGKITESEMQGIPHHLIDVRDLGLDDKEFKRYSVADFTKDALRIIHDIHMRGGIAIICGGTGFYIESLVRGIEYPEVLNDTDMTGTIDMGKIPLEQLNSELKSLDPQRATNIDPTNRRRVERALELARQHGTVPKLIENPPEDISFLLLGITADPATLRFNINNRLQSRLKAGMIDEVRNLHRQGLSYERMNELGLEYRYIGNFLQANDQTKKITGVSGVPTEIMTEAQLSTILENKIWQFARRQRTWFKRNNSANNAIKWFEAKPGKPIDIEQIKKIVDEFLANNPIK